MLEGILIGVVLCGGFFGGVFWLRKFRARLREYDRRIRECDLALLRGKPNFVFSLGNVQLAQVPATSATQYDWIRYDGRHGLFEVHPEVISWCDEHAPGYVVENDERTGELVIAFLSENDRFHFKMRWF